MRFEPRHPWPTNAADAIAIQQQLHSEVMTTDQIGEVRTVAGVDVGFEQDGTVTRAAIALLRFPELDLIDRSIARMPTTFPYVPGLLSFRETPAVLQALEQLEHLPDLLLCDGAGIAHPRRFGIAAHLGVLTTIPSIGVAKSWLIGTYGPLGDEQGAWQPLTDRGEAIGAVVRTRSGTKPLFISIGHRLSLTTAIDYVLRCTTRYRLPETTRWAHKLASGPATDE